MRLLTITTTNSHILSLFWPCFAGVFLSFSRVGGGGGRGEGCFNSTIWGAEIIL